MLNARAKVLVLFGLACVVGLLASAHRSGLLPRNRLPDVSALSALSPEEASRELRAIGERAARAHSGSTGMGTSEARQRFAPVDWRKARASCAPADPSDPAAKRVLVTGSAGFIGSATAMKLRQRGDGVVGVDNFNDYYPVSLKRARAALAESRGVLTVDGDVADPGLMGDLFRECNFTHVVHLAAQAGVRYATKNPLSYVHSNVEAWVVLLEAARSAPFPPAIAYASSSSVYGLNEDQPFSEQDRTDRPASLYAATKKSDEMIAHAYWNVHKLSLTGLRFFTVYGPWGRPDMAAFSFSVGAVTGREIKIFQGPEQTELSRDFTYIDDIVEGVVASMDALPPSAGGVIVTPAAEGNATASVEVSRVKPRPPVLYNLGNTSPHTVTELVDALDSNLPVKIRRTYVPVPATGDVLATFANVSAAHQDLGYSPSVSLEDGVKRFVDWFKRYYGLEPSKAGQPVEIPGAQDAPKDWAYIPL